MSLKTVFILVADEPWGDFATYLEHLDTKALFRRNPRIFAAFLRRFINNFVFHQGGSSKWPEESDKLFLCGKTSYVMMEVRETSMNRFITTSAWKCIEGYVILLYGIVCEDAPLGMRSKAIKDCQIGASRAWNDAFAPRFARIGQSAGKTLLALWFLLLALTHGLNNKKSKIRPNIGLYSEFQGRRSTVPGKFIPGCVKIEKS